MNLQKHTEINYTGKAMNLLKKFNPFWYIWHMICHYAGWNTGRVVSWRDGQDVFVAFRCDCGKIDNKSINRIPFKNDETLYKEEK